MGMLVLTRKPGEGVTIETPSGETIEVCVLEVSCGKIRLGLLAAKEVTVYRDELLGADRGRDGGPPT